MIEPDADWRSTNRERRHVTGTDVADRLKKELDLEWDYELAQFMKVSKTTVSLWRSHDRIPYEKLVDLCLSRGVDFLFCIFGKRPSEYAAMIAEIREGSADVVGNAACVGQGDTSCVDVIPDS